MNFKKLMIFKKEDKVNQQWIVIFFDEALLGKNSTIYTFLYFKKKNL